MKTIGLLLLAAATAGDGFGYSKPGVGFKKLLRHHVVSHGAAPPGGMIGANAGGCQFGHSGCGGGATCPGGSGGAGAGGAGGAASGRRFPNVRSQIFFLDPNGMHIGWQTGGGGGSNGERMYLSAQLTVPARYNFMQGYIYRLKLTDIPGRAGVALYPTVEVAPSTPATDAYLTHNPIPVQFTPEDFDQVVDGGNFVTKVLYLPDPRYQELAVAGVETLVSTRLEPGVDPILEADKRGTILLIVRLGAIDLEGPTNGLSGGVVSGTVISSPMAPNLGPTSIVAPPSSLPPGAVPPPPAATESVPVDIAPVTPAAPVRGNPPVPQPTLPPTTTPPPVPAPAPPAPGVVEPVPAVPAPAPADAPKVEDPAPVEAPK